MNSRLTPLSAWSTDSLKSLQVEILNVESDSRKVKPGTLFLACQGEYNDGRNYISDAIKNGAVAVAWDDDGFVWSSDWQIPNLAIPNLSARAGQVAAHIYNYPSQSMDVIGITGTNGKTSISHWLAQAFALLGNKAALIGTVGNGFYGDLTQTTHTTPDPVTVQQKLSEYRRQGAQVVSMEVSSHGLDQYRVNGVEFSTAVFTNLTRDHLDYHGSMDSYGESKAKLFFWEGLKHAVINVDDAFGVSLVERLKNEAVQVISYGFEQGDVRLKSLHTSLNGLNLEIISPWGEVSIHSNLLGRFNAANLLACLCVLCAHGIELQDAANVLEQIQPARGRMQTIGGEQEPLIVIDYAHTPDALEKALQTLSDIRPEGGKLFCVFGCGGDRDNGKRSMMGEIAHRIADIAVVTSDNPRTEDPHRIVADIIADLKEVGHVEVDRAKAIAWAVQNAQMGDLVLIAGKGHEEYQEINGVRYNFSDFRVAEDALIAKGNTNVDA